MKGPIELAPRIYGLGSELINWYVVEDEGRLTVVDAGLTGFAKTLEADLAAIGKTTADVEAVVLTHSDSDHTGLAPRLRDSGARVLIHADDAATLRKPGPKGGDASVPRVLANAWRPAPRRILAHTIRHGAKPARVEDPETYADGDVLDVPGRPRAIHTPGHDPGHCALLFEDHRALFAGDALITHPLVTGGSGATLMPSYTNVSTAQARDSLAAIEGIDVPLMLLGHGEPWRDGPAAAVASARSRA